MVQTIAAPNDRTPEKPLPELDLPLDTLAFIIAFVSAFSITLVIELVRWLLKRARYRKTA